MSGSRGQKQIGRSNSRYKEKDSNQNLQESYYNEDARRSSRNSDYGQKNLRGSVSTQSQHSKTVQTWFKKIKPLCTEAFFEEVKDDVYSFEGGPKAREKRLRQIYESLKTAHKSQIDQESQIQRQNSREDELDPNLVTRDMFATDE